MSRKVSSSFEPCLSWYYGTISAEVICQERTQTRTICMDSGCHREPWVRGKSCFYHSCGAHCAKPGSDPECHHLVDHHERRRIRDWRLQPRVLVSAMAPSSIRRSSI